MVRTRGTSLPTVVGRNGAERVIVPRLSADEEQALRRSAETLRRAAAGDARPAGA